MQVKCETDEDNSNIVNHGKSSGEDKNEGLEISLQVNIFILIG
jgi:hypothetical protein